MKNKGIIRPSIRILSNDQKDRIHSDALKILSSIGIRVESSRGREIFKKAIGSNAITDKIVRIPPEIIETALKSAPSKLDIYNREGQKCIHLPGKARFGLGVTTLYFQDPETDDLTPFNRKSLETCVRLGDTLASYDFVSTPGILQDVPPHTVDCYTTLEMIAHTTKPLVILVSEAEALPDVLELLEHLHGDLATKPFVIPLLTPISPLVIDAGTFDRMLVTIERRLPFIYVNYGMAGASTPITPYGSLTMLIAEILAGVTMSQLIHEGAPLFAGCLNAFMDMKTMVNFYDPESYLLNLACSEMMAFYQIPHYGNSGNAVGWGGDLIAAGHQWMNHVLACLGTTGMAVFVGTVLGSKVFSPKLAVYANEVIEQARWITKGIEMDDHFSLMREIEAAGPAGNFLSSDLTLKNFRKAYFESAIFPRLTMEDWQSLGCPKAEAYLSRYTKTLIEDFTPNDESFAIIDKGEAFINRNLMAS
ncbi:MAG: trimethylamine methyltransferase family protein [Desulfobacterales bacterium]|jgi:trimethylamine--corrinoid protein Co-methyltransferase